MNRKKNHILINQRELHIFIYFFPELNPEKKYAVMFFHLIYNISLVPKYGILIKDIVYL